MPVTGAGKAGRGKAWAWRCCWHLLAPAARPGIVRGGEGGKLQGRQGQQGGKASTRCSICTSSQSSQGQPL